MPCSEAIPSDRFVIVDYFALFLKGICLLAVEMESLRELDLRAAKKQVCKITPDLVDAMKQRHGHVRGGVVKKTKGGKKKKAA